MFSVSGKRSTFIDTSLREHACTSPHMSTSNVARNVFRPSSNRPGMPITMYPSSIWTRRSSAKNARQNLSYLLEALLDHHFVHNNALCCGWILDTPHYNGPNTSWLCESTHANLNFQLAGECKTVGCEVGLDDTTHRLLGSIYLADFGEIA